MKLGALALLLTAIVVPSFGGCGLVTSGDGPSEDAGAPRKCENAVHCDDGNECTIDVCGADGLCISTPVDGDPPSQTSGDCLRVTCAGGVRTEAPDNIDVDDGNACTDDACENGKPTHTNADGDPCLIGAQTGVCKAGACVVSCASAADSCDDANPCTEDACDLKLGECTHDAAKLHGTLVTDSDQNDCTEQRCKNGVVTTVPDDSEIPNDSNDCTADTCAAGSPVHTKLAIDTACGLAGGMYCDGGGTCVQCNDPTQCGKDDDCNTFTCAAKACGVTYTAAGTVVSAQTAADCQVVQCNGSGGVMSVADNTDLPDDANPCTADICTAGAPSHTDVAQGTACPGNGACDGAGTCKQSQGTLCLTGIQCATGFCADGRCCDSACSAACKSCGVAGAEGTCSNIPQFTKDSSPAGACVGVNSCDGAGTCKKDNGQVCAALGECTSASCVDGRCCDTACSGTCMACNVVGSLGTCSNVPQLTKDTFPMNACVGVSSCDGAGNCKEDNGQACAVAADCSSGNCVDGACCNTACSGTCKACNVAGSVGTCSNIAQFTEDNFPLNACVGVSSCDGAGACKKDNAQVCAANSECSSGACVDGVCCNTACTGACTACNVAGSVGTCSNIPQFSKDNFPAGACAGTSSCDGAGTCRKDNGQTCALAGDCSSSSCVDGYCCNSTCVGLCKACNVAGSLGTCSNIPALSKDNFPVGSCVGINSCDGLGSCTKDNGQTCASAAECSSGSCVDGYCCNSGCGSTCQACNVAGSLGTCTNIPALMKDNFPVGACVGVTSCDGAGACKKDNGQTCAAGECAGGNCVDGYCCNTTCTTACNACNIAGSLGTCSNIAQFSQDNFPVGACTGVNSCNGSGACTKVNGQTCAAPAECASGNCVDTVCCDTACAGACSACSAAKKGAGANGVCGFVVTGSDPDNECADAGAASCGNDGSCNGAGACRKYAAGTVCLASSCAAGTQTNAKTCNGSGTCNANGTTACTPYICGATACKSACAVDGDCAASFYCDATFVCQPKKANGVVCGASNECTSASCVEGVCCNNACGGTCRSCLAAKNGGVTGTCGDVTTGTDPDNECALQAASTCGTTGFCGSGAACQKYAAGTVCIAASCAAGTAHSQATCDGAGTCSAQVNTPCTPYICGANACTTTCAVDGDCAAGNYCTAALACAPKLADGGVCGGANQCTSNFCVEGVCCNNACGGTCRSCLAAKNGGVTGTCGDVTTGTDPDNECALQAVSTCGTTGFCGSGAACQKYAAGTECIAPTCTSGTAHSQATCDGAGTCSAQVDTPCAPLICGPTACKTLCAMDSDCVAGRYCDMGGACQLLKANGAVCGGANECTSASCVEGVCCNTACGGTCRSCLAAKNGGVTGTCGDVVTGTDPDNECALQAASTCGTTGFCGSGAACQKYAAGTECIAPTCTAGTAHSQATCDGSGTCSAQVNTPCTPYICGPTACTATCAIDGDCAATNYCATSTCTPKLANGGVCMTDNQCTSNFCVDGFCCGGLCDLDCESCANAKTGAGNGTCAPILVGQTDDAPVCSGTNACNGAGVCLAANGETCVNNASCASNNCVNVPPKTCMP